MEIISQHLHFFTKSGKWYAEFSKYNNGALQSISVTRANTAMTNYAGYLGLADNVEYVSNGELGNRTRRVPLMLQRGQMMQVLWLL